MLYKARTKSNELQIMQSLNDRMNLSSKDKQHYFNLKKGYMGELMFDVLMEKLQCECIILNDLLLKSNNTLFQIDSLIITSNTIYSFEVKNYEGDYFYDSNRIYKIPKTEIINPLIQLNRTEFLLGQLLQNSGYPLPINSKIIFINPEFTLYQAPQNKSFIFPTQINHYLNQLNKIPSKLNETHKILADKLMSLHIKESPFQQLPAYNYDQLRKGSTCGVCNSFSLSVKGTKCFCMNCGNEEVVASVVIRSLQEFQLLFPKQKITTNIIHDWCQFIPSKKRINRILEKNLKMLGVHKYAYYE